MAVIYRKKNNFSKKESGVSIITPTNRPDYINKLFNNFSRQNYNNKEMIIILNNNTMNIRRYQKKAKEHKNVKVFQVDEKFNNADCRKFAFKYVNFEYIAFFDDDDFYGANFLKQSMEAFKYVDCHMVGKLTNFVYFEESKTLAIWHYQPNYENKYSPGVVDSTMVFKRDLIDKIDYPSMPFGALSKLQVNCLKNNIKIYSTDRYNYVLHRHTNPNENHTWRKKEDEFLKECKVIKENIIDYTDYVIL